MGKTILELFRSRNENTGEVAEKKYAPRNSKDIGIQTNSLLINNSAVYGVNLLRRNIGVRLGESRLEQESVGIRPLYTLSTPILHGTDVLRLETQRTDQTEGMKNSARGVGIDVPGSGLLGGGIQKLKKATTSALTKLDLPSDKNPTAVYENSELKNTKNISKTPTILSEFNKKADGGILGKALSQPATPGQLVKNVAGAAVSDIKTKARGAIFGERSITPFNSTTGYDGGSDTVINYGENNDKLSPTSTQTMDLNKKSNSAKGRRYSKTFNLPSRAIDEPDFNPNNNIRSGATRRITNTSWVSGLLERDGGLEGLAGKTPNVILTHVNDRTEGVFNKSYSKLTNNKLEGETKDIFGQSLIVRRGMRNGADIINQSGVIDKKVEGIKSTDTNATSNLGWYHDFIPLKINRLSDNKTIYFRSTVTGLTETFSPSWDSAKFIGNPFNYYTYSGIERSVSFNLKVYALNGREMVSMWDKLKFLAELTYPAGYTNTSAVVPPFIKFTLGSFYDRKEAFIESLTYTVDENTPWEVGLNTVRSSGDMKDTRQNREYPYFFSNVDNESVEQKLRGSVDQTPLDNYRLPMIVDVQMTVKFVESRSNTTNAKLYDFGGAGSA